MKTLSQEPNVSPPPGAEADIWEDGLRTICGPVRVIDGYDVRVWTAATQFEDGRVDVEGKSEAPNVSVEVAAAHGMTSRQTRELAALLIEAADEIDRWVGR